MNPDELRKGYQNFFVKTEAGEYFLTKLQDVIVDNHDHAEKNPELARDFVQRAKGAREVLDHINSVMAERSKPVK